MFWRKKKPAANPQGPTYAEAKEATRRAVFLSTAQDMTTDAAHRKRLEDLFRHCRSQALVAAAREGVSEARADAEISALCDGDVARLKTATDEEFRRFTEESGQVVSRFIAATTA